ncbi:hypothetical protein [Flavobacterium beibuense]|uniref:Uncharacterized protein n=1 Tax=Flavobacterium beibuense TaxID=657326 RepID=A0A444WDP9_9FLAO|nr:hypothetical protein [Flavobacterium beibuense]RYJ43968.1 hypothetical protein NU09_1476 [Flavobacterium beibuense]
MKKLFLSALMLTGVMAFAQEQPKAQTQTQQQPAKTEEVKPAETAQPQKAEEKKAEAVKPEEKATRKAEPAKKSR